MVPASSVWVWMLCKSDVYCRLPNHFTMDKKFARWYRHSREMVATCRVYYGGYLQSLLWWHIAQLLWRKGGKSAVVVDIVQKCRAGSLNVVVRKQENMFSKMSKTHCGNRYIRLFQIRHWLKVPFYSGSDMSPSILTVPYWDCRVTKHTDSTLLRLLCHQAYWQYLIETVVSPSILTVPYWDCHVTKHTDSTLLRLSCHQAYWQYLIETVMSPSILTVPYWDCHVTKHTDSTWLRLSCHQAYWQYLTETVRFCDIDIPS